MNLFELFVKIGVDDQASGKLSDLSSKLGDGLKTAAKIGTAAVGVTSAAITALTTQAVNSFAEYEQLAGGAQKIFDQMDYSKIATDANNAYKELGLSANQYLSVINDVGATFAATMGDEAGYEAAKTGLKAISDYASGTGKNVDELSQKFTLITRSTSSYQSIADQFSGILPATSDAFLEQAQAAGVLSENYTKLTEVPIDEYQAAVSQMLQQGVTDLGLANNTMNEAFSTLSGSLSMAKGAWSNLVTGIADENANLDVLLTNFVESVGAVAENLIPKIEVALGSIASLIEKLAPVIVEALPSLVSTVVPSLISAATGMVNAVIAVLPDLLNTVVDALIDNAPDLIEAAIVLVQSLIQGIQENYQILVDGAIQIVTQLATGILNMLPQIVQLGLDLIVSLASGIEENLPEIIPTAIEVINQITKTITENLPLLVSSAFEIITSLANGILESLPELIPTVVDVILQIADTLTDPKTLTNILDAALEILITLATGLEDAIPQLVDTALTIIDRLVVFINDPKNVAKILNAALEIVLSLGAGIVKSIPRLLQSVSTLVNDTRERILETDWIQVGKDVVNGVWDGLKRRWNDLKIWFEGAWNGLVGSAKDLLGIHSPSRVFAGIGEDMALGLGEGWDNEFGSIKRGIDSSLNFSTGTIDYGSSAFEVGASKMSSRTKENFGGFGGNTTIVVQSVLDGKVIGETAYQYTKNKERMYGKA